MLNPNEMECSDFRRSNIRTLVRCERTSSLCFWSSSSNLWRRVLISSLCLLLLTSRRVSSSSTLNSRSLIFFSFSRKSDELTSAAFALAPFNTRCSCFNASSSFSCLRLTSWSELSLSCFTSSNSFSCSNLCSSITSSKPLIFNLKSSTFSIFSSPSFCFSMLTSALWALSISSIFKSSSSISNLRLSFSEARVSQSPIWHFSSLSRSKASLYICISFWYFLSMDSISFCIW